MSVATSTIITRDQVIDKLRRAKRALLLKEIAPTVEPAMVEKTLALLIRMRGSGDLVFSGATDRWSLSQLHVERNRDTHVVP